jgi:hypothetical protein
MTPLLVTLRHVQRLPYVQRCYVDESSHLVTVEWLGLFQQALPTDMAIIQIPETSFTLERVEQLFERALAYLDATGEEELAREGRRLLGR